MKIVVNQLMTVSSPPHIFGTDTITRRMREVLIALSPAFVMAMLVYGTQAFLTVTLTIMSALLFEYLYQRIAGKKVSVGDCSAVITGLLLAFNLPPSVPFWLPVIGSFFAIIVVKQLFGGLGSNFANPALASRAFLVVSFPVHMSNWLIKESIFSTGAAPAIVSTGASLVSGDFAGQAMVITGSTYLGILKGDPSFVPHILDYMQLLFWKTGGTIGEASAAALILGGLYLIVRRIVNWRIPFFYIASFAFFGTIFGRTGMFSVNLLFELLAGGLMMGAFFMATDYATSPISPTGKIVFGIGCGFLTALIRMHGGYPEGVTFAIIIMNLFVPLIDKYIRPRVYGRKNAPKKKGGTA